jgi:hypothetical protein
VSAREERGKREKERARESGFKSDKTARRLLLLLPAAPVLAGVAWHGRAPRKTISRGEAGNGILDGLIEARSKIKLKLDFD